MTSETTYDTIARTLLENSEVSEGKMFGSQGLKIGGKVFAMLVKGKLVVKLPRERVEDIISTGKGEPFDPGHGRVMKEWVTVEPGYEDEWLAIAREAQAFVALGR